MHVAGLRRRDAQAQQCEALRLCKLEMRIQWMCKGWVLWKQYWWRGGSKRGSGISAGCCAWALLTVVGCKYLVCRPFFTTAPAVLVTLVVQCVRAECLSLCLLLLRFAASNQLIQCFPGFLAKNHNTRPGHDVASLAKGHSGRCNSCQNLKCARMCT